MPSYSYSCADPICQTEKPTADGLDFRQGKIGPSIGRVEGCLKLRDGELYHSLELLGFKGEAGGLEKSCRGGEGGRLHVPGTPGKLA